MIGSRLGPYEIIAKLGEGGMGEVYRAHDTKLKRDVAIKVLPAAFTEDKERLARFEREAQLLAQLHHPNIASIFGLEETGGIRALVMELVEGPTLAERLEQGPLPFDESLSVSLQIAHALEEAHEKGIVHRDLKPQNIKASIEGRVKVLDFGLAKAMDPTAGATGSASQLAQSPTLTIGATEQGMILGTAAYMAPEQAKGFAVDKRADIWAFGVVLFEMLTGKRLFHAPTVPETLAQVLTRAPELDDLPLSTPPAIRRLLRRCLERNPKNRLHDIADARIVIDEVLGGEQDTGSAVERVVPARSGRLQWAIAAACAVIAAGALVALLFGRDSAARSPRGAPTRTSILLPRSAAGLTSNGFAVSPDGDTVVYRAASESGRPRLLVRALAATESRALEGTEDASYPFWSPDSREIAFFAGGELRRIPRTGGAVQRICAAKLGRGGAWSSDGTIVFAPGANSPLWKVRAGGGEPSPATRLEEGGERRPSHRFPVFLPDGRHFLFFQSGAEGPEAVFVASTDELGASRQLFEATSGARFAAPDWLVFDRAGALVAQRIDLERLAMIGEPRLLAERPKHASTANAPVVDLSNASRMLYEPADPRPSRLAWLDRSGRRLAEGPRVDGLIVSLSVSHRGDRVVAHSRTADSRGALWIVEPGRESALRLTPPEQFPWGAIWSGDDRSILSNVGNFVGRGTSWSLVGAISTDDGRVRSLTPNSSRWILPTDASGNGRVVLFEELSAGRALDIDWMPLDESSEGQPEIGIYLATPASEGGGKLSPDGRWIAYLSDAAGRSEAYLDRFPKPAGAHRIALPGAAKSVFFRDDARELFVVATDGEEDAVFACDLRLGERAEVGPPRELFRLPADYLDLAAAPSGVRFVIAEPEGDRWPSLTLVDDWTAQLAPAR